MRMADDKEELENGRMFREVCSLNGPLRGRILPTTPTSLYEHFKQSTFEEPTTQQQTNSSSKSEQKQVVTKEEAQKLRDSVLKSTRPLNPYFERSSSSSPNSRTSPNSTKAATNYTTTSYLNNDKKSTPSITMRPTPEVRSIPIIRTKMHNNNQQSENLNYQPPKQPTSGYNQTHQRNPMFVDIFEDKTPETVLKALEQLEAENRRRVARAEQTTQDEFPSPSTYYFSDDCSSTDRTEFRESPKHASYKTSTFPKCASCQLPIKDMILQALGKSFHPACFRCFECSKSLDGVPFAVNDDEQVYCMQDYERLYVPICARCQMPIKPSNAYGQIVRVVALDREYHINCYSCMDCGVQLTNEEHRRCYPIGDSLLCRQCNMRWQKLGGSLSPLTDL